MAPCAYPIGDVLNMSSPRRSPRALLPTPSRLSELGKQSLDQDRYLKQLALDVNHYFFQLDAVSILHFERKYIITFPSYYLWQIQVSYYTGPEPPLDTVHDQSGQAVQQPGTLQAQAAPVPRQLNVPKTKLDAIVLLELTVQRNTMILEDLERLESRLAKITTLSNKTIKNLRKLKETLLVYTTVLEKLLLSVTSICNGYNQSDIPIEQVRKCKKSVLALIKKLTPEKLHTVISPDAVATPDHVLCSILGLSSSCAEHLHSIPEHIRNHQPDVYWIHRLLEDNWTNTIEHADDENMTTDAAAANYGNASRMEISENTFFNDSDSEKDLNLSYGADMTDVQQETTKRSRETIRSGDQSNKWKIDVIDLGLLAELEKMGFTPCRARLLCDRLSSNKYKDSQTTLYWAQLHIDSAFEYDILLNSAPRYPYQEDKVGVEITENIVIDDDDKTKPVRMINLNKRASNHNKVYVDHYAKECRKTDENVLLFHASNHRSVKDILENGLLTKGKDFQDFSHGNGFYLSYSMQFATDWAENNRLSPPAIIVYKVPKSTFESCSCLDLNGDKTTWEKVIRYYRSGRSRSIGKIKEMREYDGYDMIDGPMCENSAADARSKSFRPKGFSRGLEYRSLCIKSQSLVKKIDDFVDFVIFFV